MRAVWHLVRLVRHFMRAAWHSVSLVRHFMGAAWHSVSFRRHFMTPAWHSTREIAECGNVPFMAAAPSFLLSSLLVSLVLAVAACSGSTTASDAPSIANPLDSERGDAVNQLNVLRQAAGVPLATDCFSLNVSASAHSDDMRDNDYFAETSPDGGTVRTRACAAGYQPGCSASTPMAELVAQGYATGEETVNQWDAPMPAGMTDSAAILTNPVLIWVGVGRSIGATAQYWTLDMAATADPSCQ